MPVIHLMFSSLQMLLDPTGGIVMTNDGNAILREVRIINKFLILDHLELSVDISLASISS